MDCKTLLKDFDVRNFHEKLLNWWSGHKRMFPWRYEKDTYKVLVAEIFLHRTNSYQVERVYNEFIKKFPDIETLLDAKEEEIFSVLKSLGLKWRQNLFNEMLSILKSEYKERVPENFDDLRKLPGIGDYIAAAVVVFTRNDPLPLLDTNIIRITGRLFCLKITDSSRRSKIFYNYVNCSIYRKDPRSFYYALIDLGALVCKSGKPECDNCPLRNYCCFYNNECTSSETL